MTEHKGSQGYENSSLEGIPGSAIFGHSGAMNMLIASDTTILAVSGRFEETKGYPEGLSGDDIMIEARVLAVADVIEAMSSHCPYRSGFGIEIALDEIEAGSGKKYDPDVAGAALAVFSEEGFAI